jgi:hypothetical protein
LHRLAGSQFEEEKMAVGIRIKLPGVGVEEFDRLDAAIDVRSNHPDGLIFSASGPVDDGWRVVDFWESRAQFDTFAAERIGPAAAALGSTVQPDIAEFPIHEYVSR